MELNLADLNRAWEIHKDVDQLLHSRVALLLVAEAFLVGAAMALVTAENPDYLAVTYALMVVTVLGIAFTHYIISINSNLIRMLNYLKTEFLSKDPIYSASFREGGESKSSSRILPIRMPRLFLVFWYAMLPECIYFAFKLHAEGPS